MAKTTVNYNPGWLGLLGVIFVVAKVFEIGPVALWSWWLVLLPFYLSLAIVLGIALIGAIGVGGFFGIAYVLDKWQIARRKKAAEKRNMLGKR
jgi:small Trp-rich protein